jgi:hypothetical protein
MIALCLSFFPDMKNNVFEEKKQLVMECYSNLLQKQSIQGYKALGNGKPLCQRPKKYSVSKSEQRTVLICFLHISNNDHGDIFFFVLLVMSFEPRASGLLGRSSALEPCSKPFFFFFFFFFFLS